MVGLQLHVYPIDVVS